MSAPVIEKRVRLYCRAECECGAFDKDDYRNVTAAKRAAVAHFKECGSRIYVTSERGWTITREEPTR